MVDDDITQRLDRGMRVFGSATLRVTPDTASLVIAVSRVLCGGYEGHTYREPEPADDPAEAGAIDPCAIAVSVAVNVLYAIEKQD